MAFISGAFLIDCPASALNNAGQFLPMDNRSNFENWVAVKKIRTKQGTFPYVSAQAFRSWLRESLKSVDGWTPSPVYQEENIVYTDANPIEYAEDDLFGYMRAPATVKADELTKKETGWKDKGLCGQESRKDKEKTKFKALTRSSPFRVSTLISISPTKELGHDYGNMARHEGDPVLHDHEFYRTALLGLFSIDLRMAGRFYCIDRTGYKHLDSVRKQLAEAKGLNQYDDGRAYELDSETRKQRIQQLLNGMARLSGGAKQTLHYTDVVPRLILMAVTRGGNHLFGTTIGAGGDGQPVILTEAIEEAMAVYKSDLLSGLYAGLSKGYLDGQRENLEKLTWKLAGEPKQRDSAGNEVTRQLLVHPVEAIRGLSRDFDQNADEWLA